MTNSRLSTAPNTEHEGQRWATTVVNMGSTGITEKGLGTLTCGTWPERMNLRLASVEGVSTRSVLFDPLADQRCNTLMDRHVLFDWKTSA